MFFPKVYDLVCLREQSLALLCVGVETRWPAAVAGVARSCNIDSNSSIIQPAHYSLGLSY
jgi:hypothetical protein